MCVLHAPSPRPRYTTVVFNNDPMRRLLPSWKTLRRQKHGGI